MLAEWLCILNNDKWIMLKSREIQRNGIIGVIRYTICQVGSTCEGGEWRNRQSTDTSHQGPTNANSIILSIDI